MAPVVQDDRARQGRKGRQVLTVLVASLVLVGIALIATLLWSGSSSRDSAGRNGAQEATTGSVTGSGTASSSNTSGTPAGNPAYPAPATPSANPSAGR